MLSYCSGVFALGVDLTRNIELLERQSKWEFAVFSAFLIFASLTVQQEMYCLQNLFPGTKDFV